MLVFTSLLASLIGVTSAAQAPVSAREAGHYFLVIDHSGSMLTPLVRSPEKGRTRWDLMRERAAGFVERLPDGAETWAIIFSAKDPDAPTRDWHRTLSGRLASAADRVNFTSVIRTFPEPGRANGTWLYQAIDKALDQVEIAGARNPDAYLTVMVYTDGVDEGHGRTRAEIMRNPASQVTHARIDARIKQLSQRFPNFNCINVYQPGDESIRDAHVVRLMTNRLQLANPLVVPRQELNLEFAFHDSSALKMSGRPISLALTTPEGSALPLRLTGGPFNLTEGKLVVGVERSGEWAPGLDVRAVLKIGYPAINGSFLVAEGGSSVDLLIQGAEAPRIRELRPASGSVFPVGRDLSFSLTTLPEAAVDWDFGDGHAARGNPLNHAFAEPGKRRVSVKVTDPRTKLVATATIEIEAVRLGIKLDPVPGPLVPEQPFTFTATSEGEFERFEWNVDGRLYAGTLRKDSTPGTALTLNFERPGPLRLSVTGEGRNGGRIETAPIALNVKEVPALRVTSPATRDILYFGSIREFRAEVEGVKAQRVRFTLLAASGEPLLPPKEVDVAQQGPLRVAVVAEKIPQLKGKVAAVLRTEVLDAQSPLISNTPVVLEREATTLEVIFPEGREPYIYREAAVRLQSNLAISGVRWDFGDGQGFVPGNQIERHTWTRYGDYTVRAIANDADGNPVEGAPVSIKVPVRPVSVRPELIYEGKVVGRDTDRVAVNATLKKNTGASGDVLQTHWFLNDIERPASEETLTVDKRGKYRLRLIAEGTPEAGSAEATLEFRTGDPFLFWAITGGLVAFLIGLARVLTGNKWRFAEFQVRTDGEKWSQVDRAGEVDPDADARSLGRGKSDELCGYWNVFTKSAAVRVSSLDNRIEQELIKTKYASCQFRWRDDQTFLFKGIDKSPVLRGSLNGQSQIMRKAGRDKLNPGEPKSGDWLLCWVLERPGMPRRRPAAAAPGPSFDTLAIYARLHPQRPQFRFWHETVLAIVSLVTLATIALLQTNLY